MLLRAESDIRDAGDIGEDWNELRGVSTAPNSTVNGPDGGGNIGVLASS